MKLSDGFLLAFDKVWCGKHQIPAHLLAEVSDKMNAIRTLAYLRFVISFFLILEISSYFIITYSLAQSRPKELLLFGILLKIFSGLISSRCQNKSGVVLSLELQRYLEKIKTHATEIRSILTDRGCSETEINSLQTLPNEAYQSELNGYQRTRILNIGSPISCGLALYFNNDILTGVIVMILGLLSFPVGEHFFKEHAFRRESELRFGLAAQHSDYLDTIYNEHIKLTTKVNLLSQIPIFIFAIRFISNSKFLLASFFGLTQGLIGLTGTLAFQKSRVMALRTTETVVNLIKALSSDRLIINPKRWHEHCSASTITDNISIEKDGVFIEDFSPYIPLANNAISISCFVPRGAIFLISAPSGKGKSTLLSALNHLIEHKGRMLFVHEGKTCDIHELSREEFEDKVFFYREEDIARGSRISDLFKQVKYPEYAEFLTNAQKIFNHLLIDLAWKAPDNLVEQEIRNIKNDKSSVFPKEMLCFLEEMRSLQEVVLDRVLLNAGGNLSEERVYPQRNFSTLSSGERKRLGVLLASESSKNNPNIWLVILDEPLAHLDEANIDFQIQIIERMQMSVYPPSILLISHQCIDKIEKSLGNVNLFSSI